MPSPLAIGTAEGAPLSLNPLMSSRVLIGLTVWIPYGPVVNVVSKTVSVNSLAARPYLAYHFHSTGLHTVEFGHRNGISAACSTSKRPGVLLGTAQTRSRTPFLIRSYWPSVLPNAALSTSTTRLPPEASSIVFIRAANVWTIWWLGPAQ